LRAKAKVLLGILVLT